MSLNKRSNNEPSINDIRKPEKPRGLKDGWSRKSDLSSIHVPRSDRGLKMLAALGAVVVIVAILGGGYLFLLREEATKSTNSLFESLSSMVYGPFSPENSVQSVQSVGQSIAPSGYEVSLLNAIPLLKNVPVGFSDMQKFADVMIQTQASLAQLRSTGMDLFIGGGGSQLLSQLENIDADFKNISAVGDSLRNLAAEFNALTPDAANSYFSTGSDLQRETDALDSMIALLQQPSSHVLLLFENTNIERPGGGRITAYADATITNGSLTGITVNDINSLQAYDQKLMPPLQLQTVETSWKLRDSDWFFDFPTSAAKILSRVQNAESAEGVQEQYSGVIALSPQVIQDLVDVLGPIQLPDGGKVTAVNLDSEETNLGYIPFLNQLMSALQERAANFSGDEKSNLLAVASDWMSNRDVRLYFTDSKIESLVNTYDAGGQTYQTASGYVGDYLAVVHTDIGNGSLSKDSLSLRTTVETDGTIDNNLDITRVNNSDSLNQEYFQIIVPSGSQLISVIGNTHNTVTPSINYKHSGYLEDQDVSSTEATREVDPDSLAESYNIPGKAVFGFWLTLLPGITSTVSVTYDSPQIKLVNGENYQFVAERQPGENASLIYSIQAPQGWQWQQAKDSTYLYSSTDLPARTVLNLNLIKS
jgi:hypothetical protein